MHPCLLIYDILIYISRSALRDTERGRSALCALAQTSSNFGPVLDILWEKLDSLTPLLLTFPSDLFHFGDAALGTKSMPKTVSCRRALVSSDWQRFDIYAARVKQISTDGDMYALVPYFDSSIFQAMELHRPSQILLPNAHHLSFTFGRPITFSYAHLFAAPNLTCLRLYFDHNSAGDMQAALLSLLSSLKEKCVNLQKLVVYSGQFSTSSTLSNLILTSPRLQILVIPTIPLIEHDILRLASLSSLQDLEMRLPKSVSTLGAIHFPRDPFPALRRLKLHAEHLSDSQHLIETVRPRLLRWVLLHSSSLPSGHLQRCFSTLCKWSPSLTMIEISEKKREGTEDPSNIVDIDTLRILFALRHLEHLSIFTSFVGINNAFMKDMATAWPQLQFLNLIAQGPAALPTTQVTLEDIVAFATQYCPRLQTIRICVNVTLADIGDDVRENQEGQIVNKNLESLGFCWLRLTNAARVISLLGAFPNLITLDIPSIQPGNPDAKENKKCWKSVAQAFEKKMERKRVKARNEALACRAAYYKYPSFFP